MPSDEAYQEVLRTLGELHEAWRIHREVINRAISLLNHEVLAFKDRLDKDDANRGARQAQLDAILQSITDGQTQIKRWQWIRLGVEVAAVIVAVAYLIGLSR